MRNGASNVIGGVTYTGDGSRVGGTDVFTGRAKLLWEPTDNLRVQFTYEALRDRSQTPGASMRRRATWIRRPASRTSCSPIWGCPGISPATRSSRRA